jgi:hypothetical protein
LSGAQAKVVWGDSKSESAASKSESATVSGDRDRGLRDKPTPCHIIPGTPLYVTLSTGGALIVCGWRSSAEDAKNKKIRQRRIRIPQPTVALLGPSTSLWIDRMGAFALPRSWDVISRSCGYSTLIRRHNPTLWFGRVFLLQRPSQCHFPPRSEILPPCCCTAVGKWEYGTSTIMGNTVPTEREYRFPSPGTGKDGTDTSSLARKRGDDPRCGGLDQANRRTVTAP